MRTATYEIPPQEVEYKRKISKTNKNINTFLDPDQGQRDSVRQRHHVLQGGQRHPRRGQRGRLQRVRQAVGCHHSEECAGNSDSGRYSLPERSNCSGDEGDLIID